MAKSEGNFLTLRDLLEKGWTGREVRYLLLAVKYREPLNFTFEGLEAARKALARFDEWSRRLAETAGTLAEPLPSGLDLEAFGAALDDDLNASAALGALFELIRDSNRLLDSGDLTAGQVKTLLQWKEQVNSVLAFEEKEAAIPAKIQELADRRAAARVAKDWTQSDVLRNELFKLGWQVKDTKDGQKLFKKSNIN